MSMIEMNTPLAELDGDEMTRVLWALVKDELIRPFVALKTEYYDVGLLEREKTGDDVTVAAAAAIRRLGVGVKCATITANAARQAEYGLKTLYPSPNATIRAALDGTVFRCPISLPGLPASVSCWKKPIVIGRHAYGDVYKAAEMRVACAGRAELVFTAADGTEQRQRLADLSGPGVIQGMHNLDGSIRNFARACFRYALDKRLPLMFAAKDTISKIYDGRFKELFDEVYAEFKAECGEAGVTYTYTLIDDAVARVMRGEGGFLWACKNYDGDVMSDMVASAAGSLALMTSVLVSPEGIFEYEAAHGTVQRHYYRYRAGEKPGTNPVALIFAWSGALAKRAALDGLPELGAFATRLEEAVLATLESGLATPDLSAMRGFKKALDSFAFISEVRRRLASNTPS